MPANVGLQKSVVLLLLALSVGALVGCKKRPNTILLQREWTANAEFAGDTWAEEISKSSAQPIEVREGSETQDPIRAVRSGEAQIGVASSDRVLRDNDGGAGLVVLATATYRSPVVFLSHPQDRVQSAKDFRDHVIGIQTGTNTEFVFKSLIHSAGLSDKDVRVVESGWGTQNFESGAISVMAAFDYDEPVQLRRKKVGFNIIYPEASGVRYVGTVYFASRSYVTSHPDVIQAFMDSLVNGWQQVFLHRDEAIRKLKQKFPKVDADKERQSLERGLPYFSGDGMILYASAERWNAMAQNLRALGQLRRFDYGRDVDYHFLERSLSKRTR